MSDPITKADIDAAVEAALAPVLAKNAELLAEAKSAKAELRKVKEINPEDLAALESQNDELRAKLAASEKAAKDATKAAETATKALETEQGAARKYALEAELATAISEGNVVPALVPAFKAMIAQQAKADLVDGAYSVTIGDKSARDHIKGFLDSEDGKAFRAAAGNSGGGAPGGKTGASGGKTITRAEFDGLNPLAKAEHVKGGGTVVDQAA